MEKGIEYDAISGEIIREYDYEPIIIDIMPDIRAQRNSLLQQSDWTQLADCKLTDEQKSAWAEYRQALRDFPETVDLSSDYTFPIPPQ